MSNPIDKDIESIILSSYIQFYGHLISIVKNVDSLYQCIINASEKSSACIENTSPCILATIEIYEPCYYEYMPAIMNSLTVRLSEAALKLAPIIGGIYGVKTLLNKIESRISNYIPDIIKISEFLIDASKVCGGIGTVEEEEISEALLGYINEMLRRLNVTLENPCSAFTARNYRAILMLLSELVHGIRDEIESIAREIKKRAFIRKP